MKKGIATIAEGLKGTTKHFDAAVAAHVQGALPVIGIVRESRVDLLYMINPETDERYIRVKVWCKTKPGLFRKSDIRVSGNSQREMQAKVGMTAGIIAEQLCGLYGNAAAEPSECARLAGKHYEELCRAAEAHRVPTKPDMAIIGEKLRDLAALAQENGETEELIPAG